MKQRPLVLLVIFMLLSGCGGDSTGPASPASIAVSPANASLFQGDTMRFSATVKDSRGAIMPGAIVKWQSSNPALTSVDSTGLATVLSVTQAGQIPVYVTATNAGVTGQATISLVWRAPPAPLNVWPDTNVLFVGMTRQLTARLIDSSSGNPGPGISPATPKSWTTSDATVATVDTAGQVTAKGAGHARVVAMLSDGRSSSAEVFVNPAPATPLQFTTVSGGATTIRGYPQSVFGPDYRNSACGLTTDGGVYCWGVAAAWMGNTDRCETQLRVGYNTYSLYHYRCTEIPYRIPATVSFISLAARGDQGCAIATTGRVYCWGTNRGGELGIGTTDTSTHDVTPIASTDAFRSLSIQENSTSLQSTTPNTCALRVDGTLFCWGGSIGSTPKAVTGGVTWSAIADIGRCGLATDSTAYCFPTGSAQSLGGTAHWTTIATGVYPSVCALDPSGRPYCGGSGATVPASTALSLVTGDPTLVSLGTYGVSFGYRSTICGLSAAGDMYCLDKSSLSLVDLGGVKLKRFVAHCGIGIDNKAYCWSSGPTGPSTFKLVPGQ